MRGPKVLQALRLEAYTDEAGSRLPGSGGMEHWEKLLGAVL